MNDVERSLRECKASAEFLRTTSLAQRNDALQAMAETLDQQRPVLLAANAKDMQAAKDLSSAMQDRLLLNDARIDSMIKGLREIIALPDPIASRRPFSQPPSGIQVYKQRIPLGVILMIYEARPNVAVDAAALTLKADNAVLLRGGKEANHSNRAIHEFWQQALKVAEIPGAAISILTDTGREQMRELLQQEAFIDLVIPRGGQGLIEFVAEHSRIPVIRHYKGVCHLYVDAQADLAMAEQLLIDGKCSRPGVCNALETLLLHADIAEDFIPRLQRIAERQSLQLFAEAYTAKKLLKANVIDEQGYDIEYLDKKLSMKIVNSFQEALVHIGRHGSQHTEVICTENPETAEHFLRAVDASAVMVNASSRFNDGGELGLGAEIGIATTKLHAYGPMGLESLTAEKFVVLGRGEVRHPL
ncbi:glutamate-5-semialdehyde dehydrogenase [Permianibacter aggregans]|uniref:Gamma-glutamyl phosphate reductase n=1 Tax=Permianibacter aggregans TaxID=1510150 RepID=A0A4R6V2K3_9GAMM|nr:glutamate-5-semialdehyde dehydrogenase [Permianibacter aggregans]QGX38553.1 glutamate-5-semialdehyde dehydrogenase [Permianibacter aggregans]TDQ50334.1 glutamate-5-semialdehyde dehydrogenase [Permianibacter aggregans]